MSKLLGRTSWLGFEPRYLYCVCEFMMTLSSRLSKKKNSQRVFSLSIWRTCILINFDIRVPFLSTSPSNNHPPSPLKILYHWTPQGWFEYIRKVGQALYNIFQPYYRILLIQLKILVVYRNSLESSLKKKKNTWIWLFFYN